MQFNVGDLIQGTMPVVVLKSSDFVSSSAIASIETSTELVPFKGVVTKVSSDGKVEEFKLRKPIGQLGIGTSIKVELQLGDWDIRPLP